MALSFLGGKFRQQLRGLYAWCCFTAKPEEP